MKDIPLSEITLRKYEKPYQLDERELIRKICLSLGLLQAGDSRDIIVDILIILLKARKEKKELTSIEIQEKTEKLRKEKNLELRGIAESNIRRQLKRLRDLFLIEKINNNYRISEFSTLSEIFSRRIENFIVPETISRIKEYLNETDKI